MTYRNFYFHGCPTEGDAFVSLIEEQEAEVQRLLRREAPEEPADG